MRTVRPWFFAQDGGWYVQCRYGARVIAADGTNNAVFVKSLDEVAAVLDAFTPDNDPYAEHDFGVIKLSGNTFFWKFDYYDLDLQMHSPDPSDLAVTARVLTIMLAEEY